MAVIDEVLMGLGGFEFALDWDPDLLAELAQKRHLLLWWGEELVWAGVILGRPPSSDAIAVSGRGLEWWLGLDDSGPMIREREYLAASDKLSNGGFDLGDLYWSTSESSGWAIAGDAVMASANIADDILVSEERFAATAGQPWRASISAQRAWGGVGRIRLRTVYEGRYDPPDLIHDGGFETGDGWTSSPSIKSVVDGANARTGSGVLRAGPIPRARLMSNGDFEGGPGVGWGSATDIFIVDEPAEAASGDWVLSVWTRRPTVAINGGFDLGTLANWINEAGTWTPSMSVASTGIYSVAATGGVGYQRLSSDAIDGGAQNSYPVVKGERYLVYGSAQPDASADGTGQVKWGLYRTETDAISVLAQAEVKPSSETIDQWSNWQQEVEIPEDSGLVAHLIVRDQTAGTWYFDNIDAVRIRGNVDEITADPCAVVPDTRYDLVATVRSGPDLSEGSMRLGVRLTGPGLPEQIIDVEQRSTAGVATKISVEVRPGQGYDTATPFVRGIDIYGDVFWVDDVDLIQADNNRESIVGTPFAVTPQRRYDVTYAVRSGPALQRGDVRLTARYSGTGRVDQVVESSATGSTENEWRLATFGLEPPSGYDTVVLGVTGTDIEGDSIWVDDIEVHDTDGSTIVDDWLSGSAVGPATTLTRETVAPSGTERIHLEVVAESQGDGWIVDSARLSRIGTPAISGDVVRSLLLHPDTGAPLIAAGAIYGSDAILYDWQVANLSNRAALIHLSRAGLVSPAREWRVNPDNTLDWGTAEQLFGDAGLLLAEGDLVLLDPPEVTEQSEDRVDRVVVVGADRPRRDGSTLSITGEAIATATGERDWYGRSVDRTKVVQDSTVDHRSYAAGLAEYLLARSNAGAENVELGLSDWRTLGRFGVGDWLDIYFPRAGIFDAARSTDHDGQTIFPRRSRVVARTWRLGAGTFRLELRRPDGTTLDITGAVHWEPETSATIEIGDPLPDFAVDPQGGSAATQFLRFRASAPR